MILSKIIKIVKFSVGLGFILFMFSGGICINLLFLYNNRYINTFLIGLLIYQYFFCKRQEWARNFIWRMGFQDLFENHSIIKEEELKPGKFILALAPHGVFGVGSSIMMLKERILFDSVWFGTSLVKMTPISGIFGRLVGFEGVTNDSFKACMARGESLAFIPGGFEEATITENDKNNVFLRNRKGFIKYAIQYNYPIIYTYTFGENKMIPVFNWFKGIRLFLNRFKMPGVILFPWVWLNTKLVSVISKRIVFPHDPNPSNEMVDRCHKEFLEEVTKLYNKYRHVTEGNTDLIIE